MIIISIYQNQSQVPLFNQHSYKTENIIIYQTNKPKIQNCKKITILIVKTKIKNFGNNKTLNINSFHTKFLLLNIEKPSIYTSAMSKQGKGSDQTNSYRNGLSSRLQQIIELLYKNNGQFPKGLPSEHQFKEMLTHCYNCYDQLDFIILDYSKHPVNYLQPKLIAQHMQRIMRVTKYLFSNIHHWMESYSLDIVKKIGEEKSYFPAQAAQQSQCASCNRYVEQILLKEAREEILGCQDMRGLFEAQLREEKEEAQAKKPLTVIQTTEYVGSVNYLTKIIKEMEDSAHGYSKLTETIEKEDNHQDKAMRYLQDMFSSMRRRLGEKCIYRLKRVIKNWEKNQNQEHQHCKKSPLRIQKYFNQCYIPPSTVEAKKNPLNMSNMMIKKLKEENHQLQVQHNTLNSTFLATKNCLEFLEKREQSQKRQMEHLKDLLAEKSLERNSLANELRSSIRNTINPQAVLSINSPKATTIINTNRKQEMVKVSKKIKGHSKFKVKRLSRQSEAFSNGTDKTLDFTNELNFIPNGDRVYLLDRNDSDDQQEENGVVDVGCQWEDPFPEIRISKIKEKSLRNSKNIKSNNRQRITIQKVSKIDEESENQIEQHISTNKDKKRSIKALDQNIKSRTNLKQDMILLSLQDQLLHGNENHTNKKFIDSQIDKKPPIDLGEAKQSGNHKISVKLLQGEFSNNQVSLQKINIYNNTNKIRQLKLPNNNKTNFMKELPDSSSQNNFSRQIKKIVNCRMSTEGNQVKRKVRWIRNNLFKPENLILFGGVSESYAYEKSHYVEEKLNQQQNRYFNELKSYMVNLRSFKNSIYDNIVMFLRNPFTYIDRDEMEAKIISDKQMIILLKKLISFHSKKCERLICDHLAIFNAIIGFPQFQ